jgi:hypothetical protein
MKESWHAEKAGKWTSYWKEEVHDPSAPYHPIKCMEISGENRKELELDVVEKEVLLNAIEQIKEKGKIWRRTGSTHSSLICTREGDIVSFCEDVSRACSVDKAAGAALLSGRDLSNCALVTMGRLSGGMVAKAARARDSDRCEQGCAFTYRGTAFKKDRDDSCGICEETESVCIFRRGKDRIN